jgi:putative aminopeptidase FrvX
VGITGHKDEIGMIVKRVEPTGRLSVRNVGGAQPWVYGEGVVDLLGDREIVSGILSFGTRHVSDESAHHLFRSTPVPWSGAWIETKLTLPQLEAKGVHIGTKAVVGRQRKRPFRLGDYLCSYALDCKVAAAILVYLLDEFREEPPARETYLIATSQEETGIQGAAYFARTHDLDTYIAIEVGPVAAEYQTVNDACPILLYQDAMSLYTESLVRDLAAAGQRVDIDVQYACVSGFGSDASYTYRYGHVPKAACIGYPTENTHGYEIAHVEGMENTARLLAEYLRQE